MMFKGCDVKCNVARANFAEKLGDEKTDSLVHYEPVSDTVTVDYRANDFYTKYAVLHECICCGKYKHLAPKVMDPIKRCGAIDKMIIGTMMEWEKEPYIQKRIEMFQTLIEKNLNAAMTDSFKASLEMLEEMLETNDRCKTASINKEP